MTHARCAKTWYETLMTQLDVFRKIAHVSIVVTTASWGGMALAGCNQNDARAEAERSSPGPVAAAVPEGAVSPSTPAPKAVPSGQSEVSEEAFIARLNLPATIQAGVPLEFLVTLEAKGGYKVNDEYPLKFVVTETAAVKAEKSTVRKEDGKLEKTRAELPVHVTLSAPGEHQVGGKLSFSVCTDERCLIEKRDLLVTVRAGS